jgi:aspartate racemase
MTERRMKTIGLFGGISWIATIPYYTRLNELVAEQLGDTNSACVFLYSINYAKLKSLYHHGWDQIPDIFETEYKRLLSAKPDCIIMACNTLHKAFDIIADRLPDDVPFFHAVHLTKDYCLQNNIKHPLFVGTAFTMSDDYFIRPLKEAGIDLIVPDDVDQKTIQQIQGEISKGKVYDGQREIFSGIIDKYSAVDAVILACTELPLVAPKSTDSRPMIDPAELQCRAAVNFALA